jgi:hypothetical protein
MPLYYTDVPGAIQTTNVVPLTANDCFFARPGATRSLWMNAIYPTGRGAGLTSISGISFRLEKWFTTASSGGTGLTPSPNDPGFQAATHTAGWAVGAVTSGTGGPTLLLSIGSGATSPGNWISPHIDQSYMLPAAANQSLDIFCASGSVSMSFELSLGMVE